MPGTGAAERSARCISGTSQLAGAGGIPGTTAACTDGVGTFQLSGAGGIPGTRAADLRPRAEECGFVGGARSTALTGLDRNQMSVCGIWIRGVTFPEVTTRRAYSCMLIQDSSGIFSFIKFSRKDTHARMLCESLPRELGRRFTAGSNCAFLEKKHLEALNVFGRLYESFPAETRF